MALTLCSSGLAACAAAVDDVELASDEAALIGGTQTAARPEVGNFNNGCTATLVRNRWLLLAAHCWGNLDVIPGRSFGSFAITTDGVSWTTVSATSTHTFSFCNRDPDEVVGNDDVMLVRLATPVPSSTATPAMIALAPPSSTSTVTVFGNGDPTPGVKQFVLKAAGDLGPAILPGDSGGPTFIGNVLWTPQTSAQTMFRVNSGFNSGSIYADVTHFRSQIMALMDAWDANATNDIGSNSWCTHATAEMFYADANGDRRPDAICHDTSTGWRWLARGSNRLIADDGTATSTANFCNHVGAKYYVGDANGDGRDDSICHDRNTGRIWVDYAGSTSSTYFGLADWTVDNDWCNFSTAELLVGDFNADGRTDLLCHARDTGFLWIDFADAWGQYNGTDWDNGGRPASERFCYGGDSRLYVGDTDADGRTDLICHSPTSGTLFVDKANAGVPFFDAIDWVNGTGPWCVGTDKRVNTGDYNGDGRSDLLCTNVATGITYPSLWALDPTTEVPLGANNVYNADQVSYSGYQFGWGPLRIRRISPAEPWVR